jgi:hypothetical protein
LSPLSKETRREHLERANEFRFAYARIKQRLKSGEVDLAPCLGSKYCEAKSLLEILGLALVGKGARGRQAGELALELAAAMPFSVTHFTQVGDISPGERVYLYREFVRTVELVLAGEPEAVSAS